MVDIAILVVLYNKKMKESKTLNTLISRDLSSITLKIVNNGPEALEEDGYIWNELTGKTHNVILENRIENAPLSTLYNEFISNFHSDYYIILDDDSDLSEYFFEHLTDSSIELIIPRIYSIDDSKFYYPRQNDRLVELNDEINNNSVMSISSGLIMSKELVRLFKTHYRDIFDERFALYGIDTSFF